MFMVEVKDLEGKVRWRFHSEHPEDEIANAVANNHWGKPGEYTIMPIVDLDKQRSGFFSRLKAGWKR